MRLYNSLLRRLKLLFYINVSDRIRLQILTDKDAEQFFNLIDKNKDHLRVFMPRIMETKGIENSRKVINIFLNQLVENNGFRAAIYHNTDMVGVAGLKYVDWINRKTEIMYWVDQDYIGQGITTACVNKLLEISFNEFKLNKVIIKSSVDNSPSNRIAEKCRFSLEGVSKEDELLATGYTDINVYSLLKKTWRGE